MITYVAEKIYNLPAEATMSPYVFSVYRPARLLCYSEADKQTEDEYPQKVHIGDIITNTKATLTLNGF